MSTLTTIVLGHRSADLLKDSRTSQGHRRDVLLRIAKYFEGMAAGVNVGESLAVRTGAVRATGTVTIESGSGDITATVNGVACTVTWATSDTNTAALLAADINAESNNLVSKHVTATSAMGVVTITAAHPGHTGNAITLAASGTGATASGTRLTGGTNDTVIALTL